MSNCALCPASVVCTIPGAQVICPDCLTLLASGVDPVDGSLFEPWAAEPEPPDPADWWKGAGQRGEGTND